MSRSTHISDHYARASIHAVDDEGNTHIFIAEDVYFEQTTTWRQVTWDTASRQMVDSSTRIIFTPHGSTIDLPPLAEIPDREYIDQMLVTIRKEASENAEIVQDNKSLRGHLKWQKERIAELEAKLAEIAPEDDDDAMDREYL